MQSRSPATRSGPCNTSGSAPNKLERWEPGTFIEASAFDNYALGRPKIDRMRIILINDPQTTMASVLEDFTRPVLPSDSHTTTRGGAPPLENYLSRLAPT